jgi:hypothetical protein
MLGQGGLQAGVGELNRVAHLSTHVNVVGLQAKSFQLHVGECPLCATSGNCRDLHSSELPGERWQITAACK